MLYGPGLFFTSARILYASLELGGARQGDQLFVAPKLLLSVFLSLIVALGAPARVLAWNDSGHMLAALLIHDRLQPAQRGQLVSILESHPRLAQDLLPGRPRNAEAGAWLFAAAARWPDQVRRFAHLTSDAERDRLVSRYHRSRWHYINLPTFLSATDRQALLPLRVNDGLTLTAGVPVELMNVVQAVEHLERSWPHQRDAERAVTLCWLLHLYADVHQPLHATALFSTPAFPEGDRGGNEITVSRRLNLHGYWDALLGTDRRWSAIKKSARRTINWQPGVGGPADWAVESWELAGAAVYTAEVRAQLTSRPGRLRLSRAYRANAEIVAGRQLEKAVVRAVHRIADVLL